MQYCLNFENFVDMDKMLKIRDPRTYSRPARCSVIAQAATDIRIENPSEKTLFRTVALLAWGENNFEFSQKDVFNEMEKIGLQIKNLTTNSALPYISNFPALRERKIELVYSGCL